MWDFLHIWRTRKQGGYRKGSPELMSLNLEKQVPLCDITKGRNLDLFVFLAHAGKWNEQKKSRTDFSLLWGVSDSAKVQLTAENIS